MKGNQDGLSATHNALAQANVDPTLQVDVWMRAQAKNRIHLAVENQSLGQLKVGECFAVDVEELIAVVEPPFTQKRGDLSLLVGYGAAARLPSFVPAQLPRVDTLDLSFRLFPLLATLTKILMDRRADLAHDFIAQQQVLAGGRVIRLWVLPALDGRVLVEVPDESFDEMVQLFALGWSVARMETRDAVWTTGS